MIILPLIRIIMATIKKRQAAKQQALADANLTDARSTPVSH